MNGHDAKCQHPDHVQRHLSPMICTFCQLIRDVRSEYGR